jgi:hypothetical protein
MQEMRRTPYLTRSRPPNLLHQEVVRFPVDRFGDLLFDGFLRPNRATREPTGIGLRDGLITIMMHGAGLRTSECFQLWIVDVQEHPLDRTRAWVRIGHPTHGRTKWSEGGKEVEGTRAEFLATHGLGARNVVTGKTHAGWKDPALDGKWYLELHWSEPEYGQLFLHLWKLYQFPVAQLAAGPLRAGGIAGVTHHYFFNDGGIVPLAAAVVTVPIGKSLALDLVGIPRIKNATYATLNLSLSWRFK